MKINISPLALIFVRSESSDKIYGSTRGPVVVLPYKHSEDLVAHELHHVKQWWLITFLSAGLITLLSFLISPSLLVALPVSIGVMGILNYTSKKFRFMIESAAYAKSASVSPNGLNKFARYLAGPLYNVGYSVEESEAQIKKRIHDKRIL